MIIVDTSLNKDGINVLQHIEDPRVKFLEAPGVTEREGILIGMEEADTPFTIIYGKGTFPSTTYILQSAMLYLNQLIKKNVEHQIIAIVDNSNGQILSRGRVLGDPIFGDIYFTEKLRAILELKKG